MNSADSKKAGLKQNLIHQLKDLAKIFLYLAFFFCAIATYRMLLLNKLHVSYFDYGTALINALVVAKVILLGEDAHLGRKHETKPVFFSALHKAFLFSLLVFAFHIVEEAIKRLLHGEALAGTFREVHFDDLLGRSLIVFCTFVPLFGFLELRRAIGEDKFHEMVFQTGATRSDPLQ